MSSVELFKRLCLRVARAAFVAATMSLLFFEIYEGVFNVLGVFLSPYTGQPFFVPSEGLASFLETILAYGVKRESENWSMKFSPRTRLEPRTFGLAVRCVNHYTTDL